EDRLQTLSQSLKGENTDRDRRVTDELTALRSERDHVLEKLSAEQRDAAASRNRTAELEGKLRAATTELERVQTATVQRAAMPSRPELELRAELDKAKESAGYAEAALKEEIERNRELQSRLEELKRSLRPEKAEKDERLEEELARLRQECDQ